MTAGSYVKRRLRVTLTLSNGTFGTSGSNTLIVEGLRILANLKFGGGAVAPTASIRVYGLLQSDMNQLTMLSWKPLLQQRNLVVLEAFDNGGWSEVFRGDIFDAGPDYAAAPDVCLNVEGMAMFYARLNPVPPTSYPGATAVADIMKAIAAGMGLAFENNGVDTQLSNPYLPSTLTDQAKQICQAANIDMYTEGNVLAICPKGVPRTTISVPLVSADTGMIGYPSLDKQGIQVRTLYNPGIRFGGQIFVQSDVPKANGSWRAYSIQHQLESEKPGGAWFSAIGATEPNKLVLARG
jgi:hypothetical protein